MAIIFDAVLVVVTAVASNAEGILKDNGATCHGRDGMPGSPVSGDG